MFPPPQKTENTPYFQYPVHLCIWMHTNRCHIMVKTQPCPKPCVILHTVLASKIELLYSCQHYAGEPPLVSRLYMTIKYICSYIMLENHPLCVVCKSLLNIFTATLYWKTIPCEPYANDYYIYIYIYIYIHICSPYLEAAYSTPN